MIANPQHFSKDDSWCTPLYIIDLVDLVLGGIDFDPASSEGANELVVAKNYLSKDGLTAEWEPGSVYLNPPGGKIGNQSSAVTWWAAMMERHERREFTHGIFMGFSLEILQTSQNKGVKDLLEFPMCVPSKRIRFLNATTKEKQKSPTHSQVIGYVPGSENHTERFLKIFTQIGSVKP
jgi:hypothetical protein